jgi:hypothetical protein
MWGFPFSSVVSKRVSLHPSSSVATAVKIPEVDVISAALYRPIAIVRIRSGLGGYMSAQGSNELTRNLLHNA